MELAGPALGILNFAASRKQEKIEKAQARTEVAATQLNSSQRQKKRLEAYAKLSSSNRARSGASGTTFSGSSSNVDSTNIGITNEANFEDIFNTKNKSATINEAGEAKASATKLRGYTSLIKGFAGG